MRKAAIFFAVWPFLFSAATASAAQKAVVIIPVADLRSDCSAAPEGHSDEKQQTQLLFGETVEVLGLQGNCYRVRAIEQMEFSTHQRWEGYPGFVEAAAIKTEADGSRADHIVTVKWLTVVAAPKGPAISRLPAGARVEVLDHQKTWAQIDLHHGQMGWVRAQGLRRLARPAKGMILRRQILSTASMLIGDPYIWGGLSPYDSTQQIRLSGVDCSGLIHLSYRVQGQSVPRDSHEQWMKATPIKRAQLRPGDLIFSAKTDQPKKVTHVAFFLNPRDILEAPQTGVPVRRISFQEKFGIPLNTVQSGQPVGDRILYFGRLLKE